MSLVIKKNRAESEETQDYVRETLASSQEEAEGMGFVPVALGGPLGTSYWCDNRCSEKKPSDTVDRTDIARMEQYLHENDSMQGERVPGSLKL